jgi:hypothetical protein
MVRKKEEIAAAHAELAKRIGIVEIQSEGLKNQRTQLIAQVAQIEVEWKQREELDAAVAKETEAKVPLKAVEAEVVDAQA